MDQGRPALWSPAIGRAVFRANHGALVLVDVERHLMLEANPAACLFLQAEQLDGLANATEVAAALLTGSWQDCGPCEVPLELGGTLSVRRWAEQVAGEVWLFGLEDLPAEDMANPLDLSSEGWAAQMVEMQSRYESEQKQATTDSLTGLYNRREFERRLAEALAEAQPVSLVLLDVDHFKKLNDTYGHQEGDTALKNLGALLKGSVRLSDVPARVGGEEFAVLMPKTSPVEAEAIAQRLRLAIEAKALCRVPITASFGVSTSDPEVSGDRLYEAADRALYASKHAGRNRVTTAQSLADAA
jgi:diguanylate cyclase (GGDEF)-like protein